MTHSIAFHPSVGEAATGIAASAIPSIVQVITKRHGGGAGVIISPHGTIVTNAHVVRGKNASIRLHDGSEWRGEIIGRDKHLDLAAIRIERDDVPAISFGDSQSLRPGQLVMAIGHPLGLADAVTLGVVSRPPDETDDRELIASNITLNRGNSGGPLLDASGALVGINTMVAGPGLGLSIPTHVVRRFLMTQVDPRPHSGMTVQAIATGLMVTDIQPESPSEAAGLIPGDIVVAVSGATAGSYLAFIDGLAAAGVGGTLELEFERAGRKHTASVAVVAKA